MSYQYFPKNGVGVDLFGIFLGKEGREFPFPVKDYENGVELGVVVRSATEMDRVVSVLAPKQETPKVGAVQVTEDESLDEAADEADAQLIQALQNLPKQKEEVKETNVEEPVTEPVEEQKEEETETKVDKPAEPEGLTREEALKYVQMEPDGTYAKREDGTYKIKGGYKPYTKEEIYKALE